MLYSILSPVDRALSDFILAYDVLTTQQSDLINSIEENGGSLPMIEKAKADQKRFLRHLDRADAIRSRLRRLTGVHNQTS